MNFPERLIDLALRKALESKTNPANTLDITPILNSLMQINDSISRLNDRLSLVTQTNALDIDPVLGQLTQLNNNVISNSNMMSNIYDRLRPLHDINDKLTHIQMCACNNELLHQVINILNQIKGCLCNLQNDGRGEEGPSQPSNGESPPTEPSPSNGEPLPTEPSVCTPIHFEFDRRYKDYSLSNANVTVYYTNENGAIIANTPFLHPFYNISVIYVLTTLDGVGDDILVNPSDVVDTLNLYIGRRNIIYATLCSDTLYIKVRNNDYHWYVYFVNNYTVPDS
jgi:hypothetical protein